MQLGKSFCAHLQVSLSLHKTSRNSKRSLQTIGSTNSGSLEALDKVLVCQKGSTLSLCLLDAQLANFGN